MTVPSLLAEAVVAMPSPFASPHVAALEDELRDAYGVDHAVAVSSGTAALQTALVACGIGPGTEVLIPAITVVMTVAAIVATGARPVFVDADADSGPFDVADAAAKATVRTRAILPVHLAGRTGDLTALTALANSLGVQVIEDACQAQESRFQGRLAGTIGAVGCFSLKDGKIIASGEGGYLLTDDGDLAAAAAGYRSHWQTGTSTIAAGSRLGQNFRLAEPLAALARLSLAERDAAAAHRRAQTALLTSFVADAPGLKPVPPTHGEDPNGFAALWRIALPRPRGFARHLASVGVINSTGTFGLRAAPTHPAVAFLEPAPCPRAERLLDTLLAVPATAHDTDEQLVAIGTLIRKEAAAWTSS